MPTKIIFLLLVILMSIKTFSITHFPQGTCSLEGLLVKATNEANWYFIVNHKTNSETRFKLSGYLPTKEISEEGQFVQVVLDIPHETFSLYGEAELKKVDRFINPYIDPKRYSLEVDVRRACNLERFPNSLNKSKLKK